ncbi:hypothetical protein MAPG_07516 [Magnaporthiopsis poae ATCC 64411]|uniref:Peroxin 20 n=1 Tax=Magnaporthiopsis poae (strain ATCC 64411 / 73-15) TaxID=644358 RepID=A0A0C4E4W2_MAGP6|nr:hypothetical protein MAPG_07516 [Magnaporthiopsis poae ATCC 64411]
MSDQMCGPSNPLKHVQDHLSRVGEGSRLRMLPSGPAAAFHSYDEEAAKATEKSFAEFYNQGLQVENIPIFPPGQMPIPLPSAALQPAAPRAITPLQHAQGAVRPGGSWAAEYAAMAPSTARSTEIPAASTAFRPAQGPLLHQPHQMPAPSYMLPNYSQPLFAGAVRPAPALAAPVNPFLDEAERARFDAAFAELDQEFSEAMTEWNEAHGPDAETAEQQQQQQQASLDGLVDRLADQRLQDEPQPAVEQPQGAAAGDPELRAVASQVVGAIGNVALFEKSQFAQLMRGIEAGTIVVDAAQTNFVDAATLEPVRSTPSPSPGLVPGPSTQDQAQGEPARGGH